MRPVTDPSSSSESLGLLETAVDSDFGEKEGEEQALKLRNRQRSRPSLWLVLITSLLVVSLIANAVQLVLWRQARRTTTGSCKSPLTGFDLTEPVDFGQRTAWGDLSNLTALDELWNGMDVNPGVIAYPKDAHWGSTQDFPWDHSKGLYMLNSYHNLHCLKVIYGYVRDWQEDRPREQTMGHIAHCIDLMRADIMCQADDTLLPFELHHRTEMPPKRMCRSWARLEAFAVENSACFQRTAPEDPQFDTLLDYMNCPPGSPYYGLVEQLKGLDGT